VFQGVIKGEPAERTTMWTALGFPPCAITIPLWVAGGEKLPEITTKTSERDNAPLCDKVVALKHKVFPIKRGNGNKYMYFSLLYNETGDGIIQKLQPFEKAIFEETYKKITEWNATVWSAEKVINYYKYLNDKVVTIYYELFGL